MKTLIYGFKPYKTYKENVTEKIVKKIKGQKNLKKVIFPVKFEKKIFLEKIKKLKPQIILGVGQYPRGKKIRIERRAINLFRQKKGEKPKIIFKNKPKYQFVNWKLKKDKDSWISYRAGKYVCNFSIYIIAEYCQKKGLKFAFLHIPYNYDLGRAVKFIEEKISLVPREGSP